MKAVVIIVLLIGVLVIYDFWRGCRVSVRACLYGDNLEAHMLFLPPAFDIFLRVQGGSPILHIALFRWDFLQIPVKRRKRARKKISMMRMARSLAISRITVETRFRFSDPYLTAMACAAAGAAARMLPVDSFALEPVFFPGTAQLDFVAHARLKVGKTILNYLKDKP